MSIAVRSAETVWEGALATGSGTFTAQSGALGRQAVTWAARTEQPDGKTSPEELCAAAHSSCFSMALAVKLGESKLVPERIRVQAAVSLDEVDGLPTIATSVLDVEARIPGIDEAAFQAIITEAAALCPVSRLFAGAEISVTAKLEAN